jgi:hypothetical protein
MAIGALLIAYSRPPTGSPALALEIFGAVAGANCAKAFLNDHVTGRFM